MKFNTLNATYEIYVHVSHSVVVHATYGNLLRLWWAARWQQSAALHCLSCTRPRWASAAPADAHRGPQNDDHTYQLSWLSCTPKYWLLLAAPYDLGFTRLGVSFSVRW